MQTTASFTRSCNRCRRRKVKCDKAHPSCSNCSQSAVECIYPAGKGRAPKRPRNVVSPRLVERLSRLETIIQQVNASGRQDLTREVPSGALDEPFGRLMVNERSSHYVSHVLWSSLSSEVEELRDLLLDAEHDSDEDLEIQQSATIPESTGAGSNAVVLGYRSSVDSLQDFYPSLTQATALFAAFVENVAPLVHVFHIPSLTRAYWNAMTSLQSVDRDFEAVIFAVHYAALVSVDTAQCQSIMGVSRETGLDQSRFAAEQALARANLLNTQSLTVLQAAVVFLTALRNQDETRTTWSLTCLVYHVAQAMGLHRDGETFGLTPFETEMRRRLWWYICVLDTRSSEYHGYEPIVQEDVFDTKPPLHINDSDLLPEMVEPPLEHWNEVTDMTFTLIRCETQKVGWKLGLKGRRALHRSQAEVTAREESLRRLDELKLTLQEKFVQHCDRSTSTFQRLLCAAVARLITTRFWLVLHYPLVLSTEGVGDSGSRSCPRNPEGVSGVNSTTNQVDSQMRDRLFQASIELLEICSRLLTDPQLSRWAWYSNTHIQWAELTFVLSELCTRPSSAECDRAWTVVNIIFEAWKSRNTNRKGTLSVPIQRLLDKAQSIRDAPQQRPQQTAPSDQDGTDVHPETLQLAASSQTDHGLQVSSPADKEAFSSFMPNDLFATTSW